MQRDDDTVLYPNVLKDDDLQYTVTTGTVKEALILKKPMTGTDLSWNWRITTRGGLTPSLGESGEVLVHNDAGEIECIVPPMRAWDFAGKSGLREDVETADHDPRQGWEKGRGSTQPGLYRDRTQHALGGRFYLRTNAFRVCLRRVRHRHLLPGDRGIACAIFHDIRPGVNYLIHPAGRPITKPRSIRALQRPVEFTQYTAVSFVEHLAVEGIIPSIGTAADAYDNALAETTIGLYKFECIRPGPFNTKELNTIADVEYATMTWVHWYNHARLHTALNYHTPA